MDKFKTTIYLPIGYHNTDLSSDIQLVRYIQKIVPREFRVVQIIDTYIDNAHSAVTVEIEKAKDTVETTWVIDYLEKKIDESKSTRFKQALTEMIKEIHELTNSK